MVSEISNAKSVDAKSDVRHFW